MENLTMFGRSLLQLTNSALEVDIDLHETHYRLDDLRHYLVGRSKEEIFIGRNPIDKGCLLHLVIRVFSLYSYFIPSEIQDFISSQDPKVIQEFLENHPDWTEAICECCHGVVIMTWEHHFEQMLNPPSKVFD